MKKYKLLICMLMTAVVITACGSTDDETSSDVTAPQDAEEQDDESAEDDSDKDDSSENPDSTEDSDSSEDPGAEDLSESSASPAGQTGSYEGCTIKDMLDNGFDIGGHMAMSMGDSGAISVQLTKDIEYVSVNLNDLDMETYEEFSALENSDAKNEYIEEHFSDIVLDGSNYSVQYMIYGRSALQTAVEMGIYAAYDDAQGRALSELLDEGYSIDGYSSSGNDCLLNMSGNNGKYIILLDLSEKNEEVDLFMSDEEEVLRDYTIVEAYILTSSSNSNTNTNTNKNTSESNFLSPYSLIPM